MASLVAQTVKRLPIMWETWVQSLGREDLMEKEMATHSSILAWKIPWTEEPGVHGVIKIWTRLSDFTFTFFLSCCSISSSNCCFLTCIQVSQEAGQVVWYSHLFKNFPKFVVIHTVKGFGIVNKTEIDVFLELSCFFDDPVDVGNLISGSSAFSKSSSGSLWFKYC